MRVALAGLCALMSALALMVAQAAPPDGKGPPNGGGGGPGGGGPGGGRPTDPGGGPPDEPGGGDKKGDAYSDLVRILRSEKGLPLLTVHPLVDGTGDVYCVQPISAAPIEELPTVVNPADGRETSLIPLGTGVEGEECDVQADYLPYVQEVLFGRLNMGRSPEKVLRQQLDEVTAVLASADIIEIDEAGRFVVYAGTEPAEIDSPGNNLAIHQELQEEGRLLSPQQVPIVLPTEANLTGSNGFLDHAAAALGAAAGKGDWINLDLIVYDNRILGIPGDTDVMPTVSGGSPGTVDLGNGPMSVQVGEHGESYVDYSGYVYVRSEVFPGCVKGLLVDYPTPGLFTPFQGRIMDCVFGEIVLDGGSASCTAGVDFTGATALHSFAQRADDARAVIAFTHDNVVAGSTAVLPLDVAGVDQAGQSVVCDQLGL